MPHRLLLECVALQDWIGLIIKGLWIRSSIRDSKLVDQQLTGYGRICTATDSKLNLSSFTCRERECVCVCVKKTVTSILSYYTFPYHIKSFYTAAYPHSHPLSRRGLSQTMRFPTPPSPLQANTNVIALVGRNGESPLLIVFSRASSVLISLLGCTVSYASCSPNARDLCPTNSSKVLIGHASCSAEASAQLDVVLC